MSEWRIGRAYCPVCRQLYTLVAHPDLRAKDLVCPQGHPVLRCNSRAEAETDLEEAGYGAGV